MEEKMSQIIEYMHAIAKERREKGELDVDNMNLQIKYHYWLESVAKELGIKIGHEAWWDIPQKEQFERIIHKIKELKTNRTTNK
jgi:hypothetical protein